MRPINNAFKPEFGVHKSELVNRNTVKLGLKVWGWGAGGGHKVSVRVFSFY